MEPRRKLTATDDPLLREVVITWQAAEYEPNVKTPAWYWCVSLVGLLCTLFALYIDNILFAFILLLGTGTILLYGVRKPELRQYTISGDGIQVDDRLFQFENLESFCIHNLPTPLLMIRSDRLFMPTLSIPIEGVRPELIREYLLNFIKEEKSGIPFSEHVSKALGF